MLIYPTPRGEGDTDAWEVALTRRLGGDPPDLLDHLLLPLGQLLCLLHLGNILGSDWGQSGTSCCPAHSSPTAPMPTHLPEDDTGVTGASKSTVVQLAAVKPPDLVMVGIQRPHALIVLDGPELHEPIRAAGFGIGRGAQHWDLSPSSPQPLPCPQPSHLDSSCVPRLTKATFNTEASCPSKVCRVGTGRV